MSVLFVLIGQLYQEWWCYCLEQTVLFLFQGKGSLIKEIFGLFQKYFTCISEKTEIITNNRSSNISSACVTYFRLWMPSFWSSTSLMRVVFFITRRAVLTHAAGQQHEETRAPVAESLSQLPGREGLQFCSGSTQTTLCYLFTLLSLHKGTATHSSRST